MSQHSPNKTYPPTEANKKVFTLTELRHNFDSICQRTSNGETFTITRYGKPFAMATPPNNISLS